MESADLVFVDLSAEERSMLRSALLEWIGPAKPTEQLALAMGFQGLAGLSRDVMTLREALKEGAPLSREDWRRVLLATEIVFASDVVGSGLDWSITTGAPDAEAIAMLRALQRKLPRWRSSFQFSILDGKAEIRDSGRD